jgi:hypothetical protein
MDDIQLKQRKKGLAIESGGGISLYLGASAFFISIASVVFFYRELNKVKKELGNVKQIKNQLENFDTRFEDMDDQLKEILGAISNNNYTRPTQFTPSVISAKPKKREIIPEVSDKEITLKEIDGEDESDSDSEISYESD